MDAFGPSQFNGGGFMPANDAQGGAGSAQKKNYDQQAQSTRRVTIKQIHDAVQQRTGDTIMLDGKELNNAFIVAKVVSIRMENIGFEMLLDDGTGRMTAKMYVSNDGNDDHDRRRLAEIREGSYVRTFGHVSGINNETFLQAFAARPITDYNEVTYHLSQVIFQHLQLSKGGPDVTGVPAMPKFDQGGYGGAAAAAPAAAAAFGAGGLNPIQSEIMAIFNHPEVVNIEAGLTAQDIVARSGNRFNPQQVNETIAFLVDEGHLYSTIDDNHFKSCN